MTDVTVVGISGATVTIPFTSADNYMLAQFAAAPAVNRLADASKFVATGTAAATTSASGIISNISGANITGTAAGATVLAGGGSVSYTAVGNSQSVFFSAAGTGNMLANGSSSVGTSYSVDAGGSPSLPGTTVDANVGTATVNAYSGYLNVLAGTGGVQINDHGAGINASLSSGGSASIYASGTSVPTPTVVANGVNTFVASDVALSVQVHANDAVSVSGMLTGSAFTDTVTAAGNASVSVLRVSGLINQSAAGNIAVNSAWAGHTTVNAIAGATETISYSGAEGMVLNAGAGDNLNVNSNSFVAVSGTGANVTLAGNGSYLWTGSGTVTNNSTVPATISGAGTPTIAGGFFLDTGPVVTAVGTADVVSSGTNVALNLASGAAATVMGLPFTVVTDTITAASGGSLSAMGLSALVTQSAAGNVSIASSYAAHVTLAAAANATETISYSGAEGLAITAAAGDNLAISGGAGLVFLTTSGNNTITSAGAAVSVGGAGTVTLAGGAFYTNSAPSLTATGTSDVINSGTGLALNMASGAAVTVQGYPGSAVTDTITAAGGGSVKVTGAKAVVTQLTAGNMFVDLAYAGQVTVNAAAGSSETITSSTVAGVNPNVSVSGGSYSLVGNRFGVAASGNDTINATGALAANVTVAGGASVKLAGGLFIIDSVGSGGALSLGSNDTVVFDPSVNVANVLGATTLGVSASSGGSAFSFDTVSASGTYLVTGSLPAAAYHVLNLGSSSDLISFGTPYHIDAFGDVTESFAPSLVDSNVVVWGGTGSQTLFGAGNAYGFGIGNQFYGGTAGDNLLVGALSIVGGGAGDTLAAGAFTQSIKASAGNTTLIGGDANSVTYISDETLLGGAGTDTFIFGTGNETITGGGGADSFTDLNKTTAGTTISITDFTSGTDKVDLFSLTNTAGSGATANVTSQTYSGGDTFVSLSDGVTIRFAGVASVSSNDFVTNVGTVQVGKVV